MISISNENPTRGIHFFVNGSVLRSVEPAIHPILSWNETIPWGWASRDRKRYGISS
jgi:hypothetical protein